MIGLIIAIVIAIVFFRRARAIGRSGIGWLALGVVSYEVPAFIYIGIARFVIIPAVSDSMMRMSDALQITLLAALAAPGPIVGVISAVMVFRSNLRRNGKKDPLPSRDDRDTVEKWVGPRFKCDRCGQVWSTNYCSHCLHTLKYEPLRERRRRSSLKASTAGGTTSPERVTSKRQRVYRIVAAVLLLASVILVGTGYLKSQERLFQTGFMTDDAEHTAAWVARAKSDRNVQILDGIQGEPLAASDLDEFVADRTRVVVQRYLPNEEMLSMMGDLETAGYRGIGKPRSEFDKAVRSQLHLVTVLYACGAIAAIAAAVALLVGARRA